MKNFTDISNIAYIYTHSDYLTKLDTLEKYYPASQIFCI